MATNLQQKLIAGAIHCAQGKETVLVPVGRQLVFETQMAEGRSALMETIEIRQVDGDRDNNR